MFHIRSHATACAFIAGTLCVGVPFWLVPYNQLTVPNALYGPGLVVVALLAFLLRLYGLASSLKALNVMAASVPAAVMIRVIVEGVMDPTRHNLWPLVVIIALGMGYLAAAPGVICGHFLAPGGSRTAGRRKV